VTRPRPVGAGPPRVGVLTESFTLAAILEQGLSDAGWEAGQRVTVLRVGAGSDHWRTAARGLAASRVSVIVAGDHAAALAAREATTVIPIVAVDFERDPIAEGFAQTLARPGGNVTGMFCDFGDAMTQLTRALLDAAPRTRHIVALTDGENTQAQARALHVAREALGADIDTLDVAAVPGNTVIDRVAAWHASLLVLASPRLRADAVRLARHAMRRKLASAGAFVRYAQAGGLLARGPSVADAFRRAGATVDRLLRGANPGDIPVEPPPRFELVLNAKTAAALDMTLPSSLLLSADHVIR
jgi:putative tryptophan/tyrosine transport system substrate-binding protein